MAILKIARMGHPVLRRRADPVDDPMAPSVRRLIADMVETMVDAVGAGLAAPQVHQSLRIVVFHVPAARVAGEPDGEAVPLTALVNPEWTPVGDERELGWEGCLSIPGMRGAVPRWRSVRYTGITPDGETVERLATGFHARCIQHECDHLAGVLYPARMTDLSLFAFAEEWQRDLMHLDLSEIRP